jgi:amino-acid N-acetyltransferase
MIRQATPDDASQIRAMIEYAADWGKVLKRSIKEVRAMIPTFIVYVSDEKIVGCVSLDVYSPKIAEVRSLVVHPDWRGKGVGKKLVNAAVDRAKDLHLYEVLSITDKIEFFEDLGFQRTLNGQEALFIKLRSEPYIPKR